MNVINQILNKESKHFPYADSSLKLFSFSFGSTLVGYIFSIDSNGLKAPAPLTLVIAVGAALSFTMGVLKNMTPTISHYQDNHHNEYAFQIWTFVEWLRLNTSRYERPRTIIKQRNHMSDIKLSKEDIARIVSKIKDYFDNELEHEIGGFEAEFLIDFFAKEIGPHFYNQGLSDAHTLFAEKADELSYMVIELEKPAR